MRRFKVGDIVVQKDKDFLYKFGERSESPSTVPCIIVDTDEHFDDSFYIQPLWGPIFDWFVSNGKLNNVIDHHNNCFFIRDDNIVEIWRANE